MIPRRTYWHLEPLGRKPTDYEVMTSRLLYHPGRGYEVHTPVAEWQRSREPDRRLVVRDWERFRDPRETTYARYTARRRDQEVFVDGLLATAESSGHDATLSAEWRAVLARVMAPLRYPAHGLQMVASYLGSLAPSGRVVVTCLLQTADEVRRIQRLAQRLAQLQTAHAGLGDDARDVWEKDPAWQPVRALVERLMVAYDWTEAFVASNVVVKPALDQLFLVAFGEAARAHGDSVLQKMLLSLNEDAVWHRDWTQVLVRMIADEHPANVAVLLEAVAKWTPQASAAVKSAAGMFGGSEAGAIAERVERFGRDFRATLGLGGTEA